MKSTPPPAPPPPPFYNKPPSYDVAFTFTECLVIFWLGVIFIGVVFTLGYAVYTITTMAPWITVFVMLSFAVAFIMKIVFNKNLPTIRKIFNR